MSASLSGRARFRPLLSQALLGAAAQFGGRGREARFRLHGVGFPLHVIARLGPGIGDESSAHLSLPRRFNSVDWFATRFSKPACLARNFASSVLATVMSVKVITAPSIRSSIVR